MQNPPPFDVKINDELPAMTVALTPTMIVMGATGSRDWQPIHHNSDWARNDAGLPDIIMNNYTQAGWISRYVTDWSGSHGRLGRLKFSMRSPLCPGDVMEFRGKVIGIECQDDELIWLDIDIAIHVADRIATTSTVRLAIPAANNAASPWHCPASKWQP